jgi:hypothetical protein
MEKTEAINKLKRFRFLVDNFELKRLKSKNRLGFENFINENGKNPLEILSKEEIEVLELFFSLTIDGVFLYGGLREAQEELGWQRMWFGKPIPEFLFETDFIKYIIGDKGKKVKFSEIKYISDNRIELDTALRKNKLKKLKNSLREF